jgi:hypothetical protein
MICGYAQKAVITTIYVDIEDTNLKSRINYRAY